MRTKTIYITDDDKEFDDYDKALEHTKEITHTINVSYYYSGYVNRTVEVPANATEDEIEDLILQAETENYAEDMDIQFERYERDD